MKVQYENEKSAEMNQIQNKQTKLNITEEEEEQQQ